MKNLYVLLLVSLLVGCGISKSQGEGYLASMDIKLTDDFKIENSNSTTAPGDMGQMFQVYLSEKDTKSITEKIEGLKSFKEYKVNEDLPTILNVDQKTHFQILAYKQGDIYYYGIYDEVNKPGYELQEFTIDNKKKLLDFTYIEE